MELFFDDYEILEELDRRNNNIYYRVRCKICGHEKQCGINNLRKQDNHHSALNCKKDYYTEYVGKEYGDYKCVDIVYNPQDGFEMLLRCQKCGYEKTLGESLLKEIKHSGLECHEKYYDQQIGMQYGDMLIISRLGMTPNGMKYRCKCVKCGIEADRTIYSLQKNNIVHGRECLKQIPDSEIKDAIMGRFADMVERCNNPKHKNYPHYGGRGIKLKYDHAVDLYLDFAEELERHAAIYGIQNSTFDRIDVNGNYEKGNLRIATKQIQSTNTTRKKVFIIEKNKERILSDCPFVCGNQLEVNGRSMGNLVRGQSKSCGGWRLIRIVDSNEDLETVVQTENITRTILIA